MKNIIKPFMSGGEILCIGRLCFWKLHYKMRYGQINGFTIGKYNRFDKKNRILFRKKGAINIGNSNHIQMYGRIVIEGGNLRIGDNCTFGEYNIFNVFGNITIGNCVLTADRVSFIGNIHQYIDYETPIKQQPTLKDDIIIGDGTWLGINSVVLAGSKIGKNCVVAANAVVKGVFPDYCILAGVPAHIVRIYNQDQKEWLKHDYAKTVLD